MSEGNGKANGNGRNANGTFARGNGGGPGRPRRAAEESYVHRLAARVTPEHWNRIVDKAIEQAEAGDRHARAWLSECLVGNQPLELYGLWAAYEGCEEKLVEKNRLAEELLQLQKTALAATPRATNEPDPIDRFCVEDEPAAATPVDDVDLLADTAFAFGEPSKPAPRVVYNYGGRLVAADDDDDVGRILNG